MLESFFDPQKTEAGVDEAGRVVMPDPFLQLQ
jgi:hypothetical protein